MLKKQYISLSGLVTTKPTIKIIKGGNTHEPVPMWLDFF